LDFEIALQIARFLNTYNKLDNYITTDDILKESENYIYISTDDNILISAVKLIKFDWYLGGIKHLTVNKSYRGMGYCIRTLKMAEKEAINKNIRVLQATIRINEKISIKCFKKCGFEQINCFYNKRTGNNILIFQKVLVPCEN